MLTASCNELFKGLRLYGAAPSLLERVVPDSSVKMSVPEAFDLMGYALPQGRSSPPKPGLYIVTGRYSRLRKHFFPEVAGSWGQQGAT